MKKSLQKTVDEYISVAPKDTQSNLHDIRSLIQKSAPKSTERTDYFEMPGYSYDNGYDYDGMFAWFSYKKPYIRLHVRPPVLENFKKEIAGYVATKSIISFPENKKLPRTLIQKLVKASITVMKERKEGKK